MVVLHLEPAKPNHTIMKTLLVIMEIDKVTDIVVDMDVKVADMMVDMEVD